MVSGVWNQLLFLGNRIDGLVRAGQPASALPSAHLALNLLQHSVGDEALGLRASEADRLRAMIAADGTRSEALRSLVALTRGVANDFEAALPALWRSVAARESQKRKLEWTWREGLGAALFRALRYQQTRYSPSGQAGTLLFRVSFDPRQGLLQGIQRPHFFPADPIDVVSGEEAHVFFTYSRDLRRFYLFGHLPESLTVAGTERSVDRENASLPELPGLEAPVRSIVTAMHGSEPSFPRFTIRRREADGSSVLDMNPAAFESNARYARRVLPSPEDAVMGMTMRWSDAMTEAARSGRHEALERLFPIPEIFISVAANGAFVGFVYQMPDASSPRGTVYEIGSPELGVQARLRYEVYLPDHASSEGVRVPVGARWIAKPNRLQKRSVERWIGREEFRALRESGILTTRST